MDRSSTRSSTTTTTATLTSTTGNQIYPFLLGHHISAYSSALGADATHHKATQLLPSSTQHLAAHHFPPLASTDGEDGNLHAGFDPAAPVYANGAKPPEPEYDAYDCESEEGGEASEEPAKPSEPRRSGSKRSRAAEVHNLSEKRRRSRINEKMKALQKLIPNSNKTDKASMLDEAIDYLKQLQLQVQMLSMRNGMTLNPPYLPPALQPLQTSHMRFSSDNASLLNVGMGMVSLDPSSSSSFGLPNHGATSSHQTLVPGSSNINDAAVSFPVGSSQSQHGFFHLPAVTSEGIYAADEMLQHHLNPSNAIRSGFVHYDGQMHIPNVNRIDDARILNSQECLSMDQTNPIQIQHKQRG